MKVIKCKDLFPEGLGDNFFKDGNELKIDGELYYTLEHVHFCGYGYVKEWVKDIDD